MNVFKSFRNVLPLILLAVSVQVKAECTKATAPDIPDGDAASLEEMVAGQKAVKAFMADGEAYLACLDAEAAAAGPEEAPEAKAARNEIGRAHV